MRRYSFILVCLACCACSESPSGDSDQSGAPDDASTLDAGAGADAGTEIPCVNKGDTICDGTVGPHTCVEKGGKLVWGATERCRPHEMCELGQCLCVKGFDDCDGDRANGCETPVDTDMKNCGACKLVCAPLNVDEAFCKEGRCGYKNCVGPYLDGDGDTENGCEGWDNFPKLYGGPGYEWVTSIHATADGGAIVSGVSMSFDDYYGNAWVLKLNSIGGIEWQRAYTDIDINTIEPAPDGVGYVGGGYASMKGSNTLNFLLFRLDQEGNLTWQKAYAGKDDERAIAVHGTKDGGFIAVGEITLSDLNYRNFAVHRMNVDGEVLWTNRFNFAIWQARETSDGGFILAGTYSQTDFTTNNELDALVMKLNAGGDAEWWKTYNHGDWDNLFDVIQTRDGGYIAVGSTYKFDFGQKRLAILKFTGQGDLEWQKIHGDNDTDEQEAIAVVEVEDGYIIGGNFASYKTWPPPHPTLLMKVDETGAIVWQRTYGGKFTERFQAMSVGADGAIYLGITSYSFEPEVCAESSQECPDYLVIKTNPDGTLDGICDPGFGWVSRIAPSTVTLDSIDQQVTRTVGTYTVKDASATSTATTTVPRPLCSFNAACANECRTPGHVECSPEGGMKRCVVDAGGCLVWDARPDCGPHATCEGTACRCAIGFDDCDDDFSSGCEVDILNDPDNCGKCGGACAQQHVATRLCANASCDYNQCAPPYADGNRKRDDGCEAWDNLPKSFGGDEEERPAAAILMSDGGIVVAGSTNSFKTPAGCDTGTSCFDFWVVKFDTTGKVLWQQALGGPKDDVAFGIVEASDGGVLVVGRGFTDDYIGSAMLVRLGPDGTLIWQRLLSAMDDSGIYGVARAAIGGFVITGATTVVYDDPRIITAGIDDSGNMLWQRLYQGSVGVTGSTIEPMPDGGHVVGGTSSYFDRASGDDKTSMMLLRLAQDGSLTWQKKIADQENTLLCDVKVSPGGEIYLLGLVGKSGSSYENDLLVSVLDGDGAIKWQKKYTGGEDAMCGELAITLDGKIVVAASDRPISSFGITWMLLLSDTGEIIWQHGYEAESGGWTASIIPLPLGGYLYVGEILIATKVSQGFSTAAGDFWLLKLDESGGVGGNCPATLPSAITATALPGTLVATDGQLVLSPTTLSLSNPDLSAATTNTPFRAQCSGP